MRGVKTGYVVATLILGCLLAGSAVADEWNWADESADDTQPDEYAASKAICRRLYDLQPPQSDYPDPATAATLNDCDSEALYYGFGVEADPVRARQCALLEIGEHEGTYGIAYAGRGMLMVMYANGVGARRDLDLATALACRLHGASSGVNGRVLHLQQLKDEGWRGDDFGFCDDFGRIEWGLMCTQHRARQQKDRRVQRRHELKSQDNYWSPEEQVALERLLVAAKTFAQVGSKNETGVSGSGRYGFVIQHEQQLLDAFMALFETLESDSLPSASNAEHETADERLNAIYRQVMTVELKPDDPSRSQWAQADSLPGVTVTKSGIRKTQCAWLDYRDAWLAFGKAHYRDIENTLGTWLTRQRADDLAGHLPKPRPSRLRSP